MVATMPRVDKQAQELFIANREDVRLAGGKTRVIAVASGKGGVGKTNVAVNLGIALSRLGKRVLVFDADLGLSNADLLLGLKADKTLRDVVAGTCDLIDIIQQGSEGVYLAPGGSGFFELVHMDGFARGRLLRQLAEVEHQFDYVLIDSAAGVGDMVVEFLRAVPEVLVVTTPEPTALTDAYVLVKVAAAGSLGASYSVIVNSARDKNEGEDAAYRLESVAQRFLGISLNLLGVVPYCDEVPAAVRSQVPVTVAYPDSQFSRAITQIARRVAGFQNRAQDEKRLGLSQALHRFMQRLSGK